jgi:membrane protein DedA with SNARE-associated domain
MPFTTFTIYSTIGTAIWTVALTTAGFFLGENYTSIERYIAPISKLVIFGILGLIAYFIFKKVRSSQ